MKDIKYWIWFSRIDALSAKRKLELLNEFNGIKNLWNIKKETLIEKGIKEKLAEEITSPKYKLNLEQYIQYMEKNNISLITIYDDKYPNKLKNIYDPPVVLYIKGNKNILNEYSIAIVGCRKCTSYGERISKSFAYNLGINNINVISGLAKGIDSFSHIGTLQAKANTIAVVGSGLDTVYPKENKYLFDNIIKSGGAVISEYVIGTKPLARNFPARNRIISRFIRWNNCN